MALESTHAGYHTAQEALEFYQSALGARVEVMMTFRDNPEPMPPGMIPPGSEGKVMHASLRIGIRMLF